MKYLIALIALIPTVVSAATVTVTPGDWPLYCGSTAAFVPEALRELLRVWKTQAGN